MLDSRDRTDREWASHATLSLISQKQLLHPQRTTVDIFYLLLFLVGFKFEINFFLFNLHFFIFYCV